MAKDMMAVVKLALQIASDSPRT